jgi:carbon-monoxide dehydrogenase medium subunit
MGTLGGSVAHADPAADYPAALMALEATIRLAGAGPGRTVGIEQFLLDPFTTDLQPGEIIAEIIVPGQEPGTGTAYRKAVHPASGFAIVGAAARIRKADGRIATARIGITGLGPKAYRAADVERLLEGTAGSEADIRKAAETADAGAEANADLHASAEYRRHLARVYTARAISAALAGTA